MIGRHASVNGRLSGPANTRIALASAAIVGLTGLVLAVAFARAGTASASTADTRDAALGASAWSPARTIASGCALAGGPQVAFPSEAPALATGPGAIAWVSEPSRCAGSTRPPTPSSQLTMAAIGPSEQPAISTAALLTGAFAGELGAVGGSFGRVAIAAGLAGVGAGARSRVAVLEGRATGRLASAAVIDHATLLAICRGYLGDVALAAVRGAAIVVRVGRYYLRGFGAPRVVPISRGAVTALAATMDYRSDVLLAWEQDGAIYSDMLRASGHTDPVQRVGPSAPDPQLQALVSDNDHGVLAWSSPGSASLSARPTRIYVDLSAVGVRFGQPHLLASFTDPAGVGRTPGSLELVRLSTENAVLAWTDAEHGHYVVRSSPTAFAVRRPGTRVSEGAGQAVLAGLAPGPAGEAIAVWTSAPGAGSNQRATRTELWAARTLIMPHDRLAVRPPEMIAAPGAPAAVSIAVNPADDRALIAWLVPRAGGSIEYSISAGAAAKSVAPISSAARAAHRGPGAPSASGETPWLGIALAALAGAVAAALARLAIVRRRHRSGRGRGHAR